MDPIAATALIAAGAGALACLLAFLLGRSHLAPEVELQRARADAAEARAEAIEAEAIRRAKRAPEELAKDRALFAAGDDLERLYRAAGAPDPPGEPRAKADGLGASSDEPS